MSTLGSLDKISSLTQISITSSTPYEMDRTSDKWLKSFIFIFDGPVSCSKLFGKLLSTHPQLQSINGYPYLLAATRGPDRIPAKLTPATEQRLTSKWMKEVRQEDLERWGTMSFEKSNADVKDHVKEIQSQGKVPIVQEHAALCVKADISLECLRHPPTDLKNYSQHNPTAVDDDLIRDCSPVILIRHPALFIPSLYRKQLSEGLLDLGDEQFQLWVSMSWVRIMYEYFAAGGGASVPVIVDAEDVVHRTQALANKLGGLFGINSEEFKETWDTSIDAPVPEGVVAKFHERLRNSTGVERNDGGVLDGDINLDEKTQAWTTEFGEEIAREIRKRVDDEMETYLYLRDRRLQVT